jgi:hypothetical protein
MVPFGVRADRNPTASFCPLGLPRHTLSGGLVPAVVALLSALSLPRTGTFASKFHNSSTFAKEQFAVAKGVEPIKEHAQTHDGHEAWIDALTENGTLSEIRTALEN